MSARVFGKKHTAIALKERLPARRLPPVRASFPARPARAALFHNGVVVLEGGERFRIVVKDVSAAGARIEFFQEIPFSEHVQLVDAQTGKKRSARVVWRRQGVAGLMFER